MAHYHMRRSAISEKAGCLELDFWNGLREEKGMKERICYVVGAGENFGLDFHPATRNFVIAADAGLLCLEK